VSREDFAELANGEAATQDRAVAARAGRDQLAELTGAMPWLVWQAHSVDQLCEPMSAGLITQSYWLNCRTLVTAYAGYDGDLTEATRRFDATVVAANWFGSGSDYTGPTTHCGGVATPWRMSASWLVTGRPLTFLERADPRRGVGQYPPVYQRRDRLDHLAMKTDLLAAHQYVAVITLTLDCGYSVDD
jgi:hypothetical protein